jgi:beta-phosphoglucomutase-like phosphatase (HAD superfamily)
LIKWSLNNSSKAILFDFDGTLVDSEPLHYEAWLHAVKPYGAHTDWDDYVLRFVGQTGRWAAETFFQEAGVDFTPELVVQATRAKEAYFRQYSDERLVITADTIQAVQQLPLNLPIGVITSSVITEVEPALIAAGLRSRLSVLVCAADVSQHKPHPEPYLTGLERLRVNHDHSELVAASITVYEDSRTGIASATAAGMTVRSVPDPRHLPDLLSRDGWL